MWRHTWWSVDHTCKRFSICAGSGLLLLRYWGNAFVDRLSHVTRTAVVVGAMCRQTWLS